jgi:hypothetical protein
LTQAEKFKNLEGIMDAHFREPKPSQAVPAKHLEGSYNVDTNPRGPRRVHFAASPEGEKLKAAMDRAVKVLDDSLYTQPEEGQSTDNEEESYEPDEDEESLNGSVIYSPQPQTQSHPQQEENAKNQNNQKPKEILASLLDARSEL